MTVRFTVTAIQTLAFLSTRHSCSKTLTIVFSTRWFFACAFSAWYKGWNSGEMPWIPIVCNSLSMVYSCLISMVVATARTNAPPSTFFPLGKTLTVKFQTVDFTTFAARRLVFLLHVHARALGRRGLRPHWRSSRSKGEWKCTLIVVWIDELFKKISFGSRSLQLVFIDLHKFRGWQDGSFDFSNKFLNGVRVVHRT